MGLNTGTHVCIGLAALIAALMSVGLQRAHAGQPFAFEPPPFLGAPDVVRAAGCVELPSNCQVLPLAARLMITLAEVPQGLSAGDTAVCVEAFLQEIRRRREDAFWQPETPPLRLGSREVPSWRWAGSFDQNPATGLVACMALDGQFLAVAFEDSINGAPQSFPAMRRALRTLETHTGDP